MTIIITQSYAKLKPGAVVRCRTRRYLVETRWSPWLVWKTTPLAPG